MKIQDLEHSEEMRHSVRGGLIVNSVTVILRSKSLSSARSLAYFGDASARAISKNLIEFYLD